MDPFYAWLQYKDHEAKHRHGVQIVLSQLLVLNGHAKHTESKSPEIGEEDILILAVKIK